MVVVHAGNIQDRDGAKLVLGRLVGRFPRLRLIWADAAYGGELVEWVKMFFGWVLEIVKRPKDQKGFVVLPRRWVVEPTFRPPIYVFWQLNDSPAKPDFMHPTKEHK